jgi:hypothetical protein
VSLKTPGFVLVVGRDDDNDVLPDAFGCYIGAHYPIEIEVGTSWRDALAEEMARANALEDLLASLGYEASYYDDVEQLPDDVESLTVNGEAWELADAVTGAWTPPAPHPTGPKAVFDAIAAKGGDVLLLPVKLQEMRMWAGEQNSLAVQLRVLALCDALEDCGRAAHDAQRLIADLELRVKEFQHELNHGGR